MLRLEGPPQLQEPGCMTADELQWYLAEPLRIDPHGDLLAPDRPGLGVEPDPARLARYRVG